MSTLNGYVQDSSYRNAVVGRLHLVDDCGFALIQISNPFVEEYVPVFVAYPQDAMLLVDSEVCWFNGSIAHYETKVVADARAFLSGKVFTDE